MSLQDCWLPLVSFRPEHFFLALRFVGKVQGNKKGRLSKVE